jgi:hypothetical protein
MDEEAATGLALCLKMAQTAQILVSDPSFSP